MAEVIAKLEAGRIRGSPGEPTAIDNVLASGPFERAPMLKRLLVYLWKHRGEEFSEYTIATEALGRRADFDPKIDATVRVEISRLRQHLREFYENDGATASTRVRVPLGSHYLEVFQAEGPNGATRKPDLTPASPSRGLRLRLLIPIVLSCSILVSAYAYVRIEKTLARGIQSPTHVDTLPPFWQAFLSNGLPIHIVLPRPTFFALGDNVIARDLNVNESSGWQKSPNLTRIARQSGLPSPRQSYVVASDALGAICLTSYLRAHSFPVTVTTTADAPEDLAENGNIVALGTSRTLSGFDKRFGIPDVRLSFHLSPGAESVENWRPARGEPKQFVTRAESKAHPIYPGVLAVLPGLGRNTRLMILEASPAQVTLAMATFLTSPSELDQLGTMWKANGSPTYFEAVLNSEMDGDQPLITWAVAMHAWKGPR
jgi:hypothetical protein